MLQMHEYFKYVEEAHASFSDDAVIFGVSKCCVQSAPSPRSSLVVEADIEQSVSTVPSQSPQHHGHETSYIFQPDGTACCWYKVLRFHVSVLLSKKLPRMTPMETYHAHFANVQY